MNKPLVGAALAFCLSTLGAQQEAAPATAADPARFVPADYRNLIFINFAALRSAQAFDAMRKGEMKQFAASWERSIGCTLDDLDLATIIVGAEQGMRTQILQVLHGNKPLALPAHLASQPEERVGKFTIRRRGDFQAAVHPRPDLLLIGTPDIITPQLEKADHRGGPVPDIQSLTAGAEHNLIGLVVELEPAVRERMFAKLFADVAWPVDDMPQWLSLRALRGADKAAPHLFLEWVLRHRQAGEGSKVTEAAVAAALVRLQEMPGLKPLQQALVAAETKRRVGDVVVRLDLGEQSKGAPLLATALTELIGNDLRQQRQVQVKAAAPAPAPADAPPVVPPAPVPPPAPAPAPQPEQPPR